MTKSMKKAIALCLFSMGVVGLMAQSNEFKIDVQKTGAPIQSTMYGIFFEDINYGADGGLYAELVKNRSFEFENPFGGWTPFGNVSVQTQKPCFDRNPHYVRLSYEKELTGTGLDNEGFNGIGIREGEKYDFSLYARTRSGDAPVKLRINLVDSRNDLYEQKEIEVSGKEWKKYTVVLTPGATEARSRLRITMVTKGIVDLEHISLFPQKTFNNRPNGMRADLAQALKELKPGVFRFPGGCIVEGTNKATRYQWKNTVGPVENRQPGFLALVQRIDHVSLQGLVIRVARNQRRIGQAAHELDLGIELVGRLGAHRFQRVLVVIGAADNPRGNYSQREECHHVFLYLFHLFVRFFDSLLQGNGSHDGIVVREVAAILRLERLASGPCTLRECPDVIDPAITDVVADIAQRIQNGARADIEVAHHDGRILRIVQTEEFDRLAGLTGADLRIAHVVEMRTGNADNLAGRL